MPYNRSTDWKIVNSWWVLLSFIPGINWLGILIAGVNINNKKWKKTAFYYALPWILLMVFGILKIIPGNALSVLFFISLISWIASIVHSFVITSKYLPEFSSKMELDNQQIKRARVFQIRQGKYASLMRDMYRTKNEILRLANEVKVSDTTNQQMMNEIQGIVDKYYEQTANLVFEDERLSRLQKSISIEESDNDIKQLNEKVEKTTKFELQEEYANMITLLEKQKVTYNEIADQKELIDMRINKANISMKQIKYDLIKVSGNISEEKRKEFFVTLEDKSNEINEYLGILKNN